MSNIFRQEQITTTKTFYNLVPYQQEVTETKNVFIGRKCDPCFASCSRGAI